MVDVNIYRDILIPNKIASVIEKEKHVKSLKSSLINVIIAALISVILSTAYYQYLYVQPNLSDLPVDMQKEYIKNLNRVVESYSLANLPMNILIVIIFFYISNAILYGTAKILGGNGKFAQQTHFLAILALMVALVLTPLSLLFSKILFGREIIYVIIFSILIVAGSIYYLFLTYRILRGVHVSFSRNNAILAIVIHSIIISLVSLIWGF